ncbi:Hypothetical protein FKW44_013788 [Caligus rogercresseyi]|uniref:Uncharacterized protein n=1 Tax=Caligus rogercresseyi TaxID=217165 RepID=A0A7T8GY29_CALRO|nr:Hypothetical protein FKW44_013788 [Caligus rogercresseyi]
MQKYSTAIWFWGFKPTYIGKNTSKETLKCHFVPIGSSGPASRNNGVLGFQTHRKL